MPLAFTITLEKDLPAEAAAYQKAGPGKALAREADRLDTAARAKKVTAITSLLSETRPRCGPSSRRTGSTRRRCACRPSSSSPPPTGWRRSAR